MTGTSGSPGSWPRGRSRHGGVDEIGLPGGVTGRLWLAGRRYVAPAPDAALESVGAATVVCLCEELELAERWPDYVAWLRADHSPAVWLPVADLHAPDVDDAAALARDLALRLRSGEGLLVHCGAGYGRAGTVAVAVLMALGVARPDALGAVAAGRPGAGPEVGAQVDLLQALEAGRG